MNNWPINDLPDDHDQHIKEWLNKYLTPGDTFYDIGANRGLFSLQAAQLGANVIAIEPVPSAAAAIPQHPRITVVNAAVWSHRKFLRLELPPNSQHAEVQDVPGMVYPWKVLDIQSYASGVPLTDLVQEFGKPTVIKSDTQGSESHLLDGAGYVEPLETGIAWGLAECRVMILESNDECLRRHNRNEPQLLRQLEFCGFQVIERCVDDILCMKIPGRL